MFKSSWNTVLIDCQEHKANSPFAYMQHVHLVTENSGARTSKYRNLFKGGFRSFKEKSAGNTVLQQFLPFHTFRWDSGFLYKEWAKVLCLKGNDSFSSFVSWGFQEACRAHGGAPPVSRSKRVKTESVYYWLFLSSFCLEFSQSFFPSAYQQK